VLEAERAHLAQGRHRNRDWLTRAWTGGGTEVEKFCGGASEPLRPRAIWLRYCDLTTPVSIKRAEPCSMSYSPPQATSASPTASCISPWLRSARRIEHSPPRPSVRRSTKQRQSSLALACGFASRCVRHHVSGLPSPAGRAQHRHACPAGSLIDVKTGHFALRYVRRSEFNLPYSGVLARAFMERNSIAISRRFATASAV
jgi:hypothetical protein